MVPKIADVLNAKPERYPTRSGEAKWSKMTVKNIVDRVLKTQMR
jgi:hypothetical protein